MAARALATAFVNIVPGTQELEKYLKSDLGKSAGGAGIAAGASLGGGMMAAVKRFAGPIMATIGTVQISQFLKNAVSDASNFQAEFEGVNQVFGKSAKQIQDYAKTAARVAGMSETEALNAAKSFGIFAKQANLSGKAAADFSIDMTQLAGDLGSFNDVPTADALMAIQSGLMGQAEPLRKFGVFLTEDALKQEALNLKLWDGHGALSASEKMMASYSIIMKDTKLQQGDFAKYSEDFGNALKSAQKSGEDLSKEIGMILLPALTDMVVYVRDEVIPKVSGFVQAFKDGKTPINDVVTALGGFVGFVVDNWGSISSMATPILGAVAAFKAYKTALELAAIAQGVFNTVMMANPVAIAITAIGVAIGFTINFFTKYKKENEKLVADIKAIWDGIVKWFSDLGARVVEGLWNGLKKSFPSVTNWMEQSAKDLAAAFAKNMGIRSPSRVFDEFGQNIGEGLVQGMDSMQGAVEKSAATLGKAATSGFSSSLLAFEQMSQGKGFFEQMVALGSAGTLSGSKFFKPTDPGTMATLLQQGGVANVNGVTMADILAAGRSDAAGAGKAAKGAKKSGESYYAEPAIKALLEKAGYSFAAGWDRLTETQYTNDLLNRLQGGWTLSNGKTNIGSVTGDPGSPMTVEMFQSSLKPLLSQGYKVVSGAQNMPDLSGVVSGLQSQISGLQQQMAYLPATETAAKAVLTDMIANLKSDLAAVPKLARGGFVNRPTRAIIGEAGPEVVTPLKDFERMMGIGNFERNQSQKVIHYHAAPNQSIDREEALFKAMRRAKVVAGW